MTPPRPPLAQAPAARLVLLFPAGAALLTGLDGAAILLGVDAPVDLARLADQHGPLMVLGFVATVIALERAAALARTWGFVSPLLLGLGALALILAPLPLAVGRTLTLLGTAAMVALYVPLWRRNRDDAVALQAAGAIAAAIGAAGLLAGSPVSHVLPCLIAFVLLTILGERLELSRIVLRRPVGLLVIGIAVLGSLPVSLVAPGIGVRLLAVLLIAAVAWLLVHDPALRTARAGGLPGFVGIQLSLGYLWLLVPAGLWLVIGPVVSGTRSYDALVHAFFLGFVIAMIMAHAPIILPAVLRVDLPYTPWMHVPSALLHLSLLIRLGIGDALDLPAAVRSGGVLGIVSLLLFAALSASQVRRRRRRKALR